MDIIAILVEPLVLFFIGAVVTGGVMILVISYPSWLERTMKKRRSATGETELRIAHATIVDDLAPLIDKLLREENIPISQVVVAEGIAVQTQEEPLLRIVGSDGRYINKGNSQRLKDALKNWIRKGVRVQYVLLNPHADAVRELGKFKNDLANGSRFEVHLLRTGEQGDADAAFAEAVKECGWQTFHPTLYFGKDDQVRAMWIEGYHGDDSEHAKNVRYAGPQAIARSDALQLEYARYEHQTDLMISHCDQLVPPSG